MVRAVRLWVVLKLSLALGLVLPCAASSQYQPPRHTAAPSPLLVGGGSELELGLRADAGTQIEQDRSPAEELAEHRKLDRALAALGAQRAGTVDAYVVA